MRHSAKFAALAIALLVSALPLGAQSWVTLGPFGGDVRSLAYDPQRPDRVFLGTSAGQLYRSDDGGGSWSRCAVLGDDASVLDNIAIDPRHPATMYVAAWSLEGGGDLFRSRDGGATWTTLSGLHGKSIRALALAPSEARIIVAGALDGLFRSSDGGDTWERISPAGHPELKNIESLAIDPYHPEVIYAGTWHLPWKTSDGGLTWHAIKEGVVDDSDVFSLAVDRKHPTVIYASACTGIYKSNSAGELFRRVQGIPKSAQRTRVLEPDPVNSEVVYAGTTEGLWKTEDGGTTWRRWTADDLVVNDIVVDPRRPERVLLATDRAGVLASNDGGHTFTPTNRGFAHRQVSAVVADRRAPNTLYVAVINDKDFGGVFVTRDAGVHWRQLNAGLGQQDVFTLEQAPSGTLLAGTARGLFALAPPARQWRPLAAVDSRALPANASAATIARVSQLELLPGRWLAATAVGLFTSVDEGRSWKGSSLVGEENLVAVAASGDIVLAAAPRALFVSRDRGASWEIVAVPPYVRSLEAVAITPAARLWIFTDQGAFTSKDGRSWEHIIAGVPARNLRFVTYDAAGRRLLGAAVNSGEVFASDDDGRTWTRLADSGWSIRRLIVTPGRLLAATPFSGIVAPAEHDAAAQPPAGSSPRADK